VRRFAHALIWNWLIAGTDAHAKNYSLNEGGPGVERIAALLRDAMPATSTTSRSGPRMRSPMPSASRK
jgi:serine/threonine-protein kinase HipA